MKLYYRLLDALEDEALDYIETQQVARNGCEVLRLLKSKYALETQYIETRSYDKSAHLDFRQE